MEAAIPIVLPLNRDAHTVPSHRETLVLRQAMIDDVQEGDEPTSDEPAVRFTTEPDETKSKRRIVYSESPRGELHDDFRRSEK